MCQTNPDAPHHVQFHRHFCCSIPTPSKHDPSSKHIRLHGTILQNRCNTTCIYKLVHSIWIKTLEPAVETLCDSPALETFMSGLSTKLWSCTILTDFNLQQRPNGLAYAFVHVLIFFSDFLIFINKEATQAWLPTLQFFVIKIWFIHLSTANYEIIILYMYMSIVLLFFKYKNRRLFIEYTVNRGNVPEKYN